MYFSQDVHIRERMAADPNGRDESDGQYIIPFNLRLRNGLRRNADMTFSRANITRKYDNKDLRSI